jgi:DNA-binding MarR family transcriptional regulator
MLVEILTKEDLENFRIAIISDITEILDKKATTNKKWLKSYEVRKLLNISAGTLQAMRSNKTISYTKIGNILFYKYEDIEKLMRSNKIQ